MTCGGSDCALRLASLTIALEYSDEDAPCFLASHFHFSGEGHA
jgi:hypothetical protein